MGEGHEQSTGGRQWKSLRFAGNGDENRVTSYRVQPVLASAASTTSRVAYRFGELGRKDERQCQSPGIISLIHLGPLRRHQCDWKAGLHCHLLTETLNCSPPTRWFRCYRVARSSPGTNGPSRICLFGASSWDPHWTHHAEHWVSSRKMIVGMVEMNRLLSRKAFFSSLSSG
ncbi:hypothetical protein RIB2604_01803540 [Aspergillus luchuensis]|uniref:Uncharacterized protein n=1 Tax=Aspergillus kawachii TaxID=1069201 RepID=A0A146FF50_ASPKA|nr:hypothetical protein RIB2604_01803540 [Aspergillus luchuensis]